MLLKPSLVVPDVTQINLPHLKKQGIRGFIFDLDNTLMVPKAGCLDDSIASWLKEIQEQGFQCVVVSNNRTACYIEQVTQVLSFPVIGNAKKPRRRFFRQALELMTLDANQVAVVGDRPLTDIWGGVRLGAFTILVDPLTRYTDPLHIRFLRRMERLFIHPAAGKILHLEPPGQTGTC